jgi:hypothetical protein
VPTSLSYQEASPAADKAADVRADRKWGSLSTTLTLPRKYDQRWIFVSCSKCIQADHHRRGEGPRLHVHGVRVELRTVVQQPPQDTRAVTLVITAITPLPSDPGPPLVQQSLSSESTSETEQGPLVEGPTVNYLRCATWALMRPPRFTSCAVISNSSYGTFITGMRRHDRA